MQRAVDDLNSTGGGIQIRGTTAFEIDTAKQNFLSRVRELGIGQYVETIDEQANFPGFLGFQLRDFNAKTWAPAGDTAQLCGKLNLDTRGNPGDLEREILLAMLLCPVPFQFPSFEELRSSVRIRMNIVEAARKTSLAFGTQEAERPAEYWTYDEDRGFILRPGKSLIAALQRATQPKESGKRYTFSCRRAAEYIVLLGVASEAIVCNTELFRDLQHQAEIRAIKGREFESVFLRPIGSPHNPLPLRFFVPGDRTWFRNPDQASSEITGYEGSWTFYLGAGLFADFWRPGRIYDLTSKCLSIYHWRNATYRDPQGELQIDEQRVETLVDSMIEDSAATDRVLQEMLRLQEPLGTYNGGCIEAHREYPRQVCCGTSDLVLPDIKLTKQPVVLLN